MTTFGKIKTTNQEPKMIELNFKDYVFSYEEEDFTKATLEYKYDEIEIYEFIDGKKNTTIRQVLSFTISALDQNQKTFHFDFDLDCNLKELNKMKKTPTIINDKIVDGEVLFTNPYTGVEFLDVEKKEDIHRFTPYYYVQKENENIFTFKIQYQNLFIWFKVELSD